ncbi:MAG TPA: 5'-methylthioadenosine/adenosylhomocysteine nucleosidase [Pseudogracilibacillus sp.]|nr:5'-methylthioadenosine/adenosylhomocysteine nucleosidase [Pseudogracilibacillus sp.]
MKYGIIGAMEEEVAYVKAQIEQLKEVTIANCTFYEGKIQEKNVVLLQSGIGKVNAAMATTILMERFAPDIVINTGSAGGFSTKLSVGDLVISDEVVHHDVDATAFEYAYGQVPQMPPSYKAEPILIEKISTLLQEMNLPYEIGLIATGDSFMSDSERVAFVKEQFPNMLAAEMEGVAIAQVCYQYDIPFIIIRALSDIAGKDSAVSFEHFLKTAAKNSSDLILRFIKEVKYN